MKVISAIDFYLALASYVECLASFVACLAVAMVALPSPALESVVCPGTKCHEVVAYLVQAC